MAKKTDKEKTASVDLNVQTKDNKAFLLDICRQLIDDMGLPQAKEQFRNMSDYTQPVTACDTYHMYTKAETIRSYIKACLDSGNSLNSNSIILYGNKGSGRRSFVGFLAKQDTDNLYISVDLQKIVRDTKRDRDAFMKCLASLSSEVSKFGELLRQKTEKNTKIVLFIEDFSPFLPDFDRSSPFVENEAFKNFEYIMSGMVKYAAKHNICIIGSLDIEYTFGFEFTDAANSHIFEAFNSSSFDVLRFYEPDEDTMALIVRDRFKSKGIECDDIVLDTMISIVLRHTKPTYMNSFVKMMTFTDKAIDYCIALHETPDQDIVSKVLNMFETGFSVL